MTLNKLYKELGELIAQGHGRKRVCVDKTSFRDNCESDGYTILPVCRTDVQWITEGDGDGGVALNKDGSERGHTTVILGGSAYAVSES